MVVNRKGLLGSIVVENDSEQLRVTRELRDETESKLPREKVPIVFGCQRVAHRKLRDRPVEPIAGNEDVLGSSQRRLDLGKLLRIVVVVEGELLATVGFVVCPRQPEWDRIVPVLERKGRSGRHVLV